MKPLLAAVYYNNHDVRIQEMPIPKSATTKLCLKVMASGICGSDVIEWYRVPKAPIVLGHEATGIIDKVGSKVKGVKVGDRVFVSHHVPCNKCRYCQRGSHTACHTLHTTNYYPRRLLAIYSGFQKSTLTSESTICPRTCLLKKAPSLSH